MLENLVFIILRKIVKEQKKPEFSRGNYRKIMVLPVWKLLAE